jgi:hypothetical protein
METRRARGRKLFLVTPDQLRQPKAWSELDPRLVPYFLLVLWWVEGFLTKPNRELGRAGPVCPFASPSLERDSFWLTAIRGAEPTAAAVEKCVLGYRDWFLELPPVSDDEAQYKTILMLFPDIPEDCYAAVVDETQRRLKPQFVKEKLMIGQFHPNSDEPGVQNAAFRPLQSPVPMLVIRHITAGDIVFMKNTDGMYNPDYLQTYLKMFVKGLPGVVLKDMLSVLARHNVKQSGTAGRDTTGPGE